MGYGWRGRIGLLVPSSNTTMECEFQKMAPKGISVHVARMHLSEHTVQGNVNMEKYSVNAAMDLSTAEVNVLVFGCTSGSFIGGVEWERKLTHNLENETKLPVITTSRAIVEALKIFDARKIVVCTPYPEEIDQREKAFLEDSGFSVLKMKGLGFVKNTEVGRQKPDTAYKLAKEVFVPEADAVFISCTNLRTMEIIDVLERDLGKPVVTSTQASMWAALRRLGIRDQRCKYGRLLSEHL